MRIVQINAVYGYGSTGRICEDIAEELCKKGHKVYTAYGGGYTDNKDTYRIGSHMGTKVHGLLSRIFGLQGYFSTNATKRLIKYIVQKQPDVVHLHNLHGNYININMLLNYLAKNDIATVITLHDCFFYTGKCVYYSIAGCNKWKIGCGKCPQLKEHNKSWFFDRTSKMLEDKRKYFNAIPRLGVVGVSQWITNEARQSILKNASVIECIYNWVDLDVFYPHASDIKKTLGIENKTMILGVAISWIKEKGIDDFNKLADMLDDKYKIVLVGKKSQYINEKIMHIDRTESIELLSDLYSAADVFYNPTKRETFGKVTAEALACGTPVIAYDTTACTELVNDECGYIEKPGDVQAVHRDIKKIAGKKEYYIKPCRSFATQNFNKKDCIEKTLELYKRLNP